MLLTQGENMAVSVSSNGSIPLLGGVRGGFLETFFCAILLGLDWQIQTIPVGFANPTGAALN
jgi:hypothetical protein